MPRSATFDVRFKAGGFDFSNPSDRERVKKFGSQRPGKFGHFKIAEGSPSRAYWMLKFHFGPMIDAFVRLSGNTNKEYWHHRLKALFLTDVDPATNQVYVRSLSDLSDDEMYKFNQQCKDHLKDEGGHLDEDDWRVYEKTKKREAVPE